jgi:hypothetical protein
MPTLRRVPNKGRMMRRDDVMTFQKATGIACRELKITVTSVPASQDKSPCGLLANRIRRLFLAIFASSYLVIRLTNWKRG